MKKNIAPSRVWFSLALTFGVAVACVVITVTSFFLVYHGKVLPGVRVHALMLENRTQPLTVSILEKYFEAYEQNQFLFTNGAVRQAVPIQDLGIHFSAEKTAERAFSIGRTGSPLKRFQEILQVYREGVVVSPEVLVDVGKFTEKIAEITQPLVHEPISARYQWENNTLVIVPDKEGTRVDNEALVSTLTERARIFSFGEVMVPLVSAQPAIRTADAESLKSTMAAAITHPVVLSYQGREWRPDAARLLTLIQPQRTTGGAVVLDVSHSALDEYLLELGKEIELPPKEGKFEESGGRVTAFEFPQDGIGINKEKVREELPAQLLGSGAVAYAIPVIVTKAEGAANRYGITALLGEGTTNFAGSASGRIQNIGIAASRVSGFLVPSGAIFSFNAAVGEISGRTGYAEAYIISDRRTILGTGGGVCQVSTTLFRAAFNAGLEIIERHPHAYRVKYYEPAGLDASVYGPYLDLQFKNNTPQHVLMVSYFNPASSELTYRIYGTNDGREVQIAGPSITNGAGAPAPRYQEDASLAPGEVKQVDFPAQGAYATVSRIVRRDGKELINEVVKSTYSPWQAVFLVGPDDDDDEG